MNDERLKVIVQKYHSGKNVLTGNINAYEKGAKDMREYYTKKVILPLLSELLKFESDKVVANYYHNLTKDPCFDEDWQKAFENY